MGEPYKDWADIHVSQIFDRSEDFPFLGNVIVGKASLLSGNLNGKGRVTANKEYCSSISYEYVSMSLLFLYQIKLQLSKIQKQIVQALTQFTFFFQSFNKAFSRILENIEYSKPAHLLISKAKQILFGILNSTSYMIKTNQDQKEMQKCIFCVLWDNFLETE